jgi:hypothetical protein
LCFDYRNNFKKKSSKIKIPYFIILVYFGYDIESMALSGYWLLTSLVFWQKKMGLTVACFNWAGLNLYVLKSVGVKYIATRVLALNVP